jgi:glutathione S-transferase
MALEFFHAPNSRSAGTRFLLEELGVSYELVVLDLKAGTQRQAGYLTVNPLGKVPAIRHDGQVVTEQGAIFLYLADAFPAAKLAPPIGDPLRGPYLRWMAFYGSSFEPAIIDRAQKRAPAPASQSPYGDFDTMWGAVTSQLRHGPYFLGERFTALDVLWGMALRWVTQFGLVPEVPETRAYIERVTERPAFIKTMAADMALAAGASR